MHKKFIEKEWERYLDLTGLSEQRIHPVQRAETKKAFMAGMSQLLVGIIDIGMNENEESFSEFLDRVQGDLDSFWVQEVIEHAKMMDSIKKDEN